MYKIFKDDISVFYKTDTHINLKGNCIIYKTFVDKINQLFHLNIDTKNITLNEKITNLVT